MSYINRQGGVVSKAFNDEACSLFEWLIPRSIRVNAIHVGRLIVAQSPRSHRVAHLEESGAPVGSAVKQIQNGLVRNSPEPPPLPLVLSDRSPFGGVLQRLSQPWTGLSLYAFPLIPLLEKTLVKISEDQVDEVIFIAPNWPRSWYYLLHMACKIPLQLPCRRVLLSQLMLNKGTFYHTNLLTFRLTAWKLSSVPSRIKAFQKWVSKLSSLPLEIDTSGAVYKDRWESFV